MVLFISPFVMLALGSGKQMKILGIQNSPLYSDVL